MLLSISSTVATSSSQVATPFRRRSLGTATSFALVLSPRVGPSDPTDKFMTNRPVNTWASRARAIADGVSVAMSKTPGRRARAPEASRFGPSRRHRPPPAEGGRRHQRPSLHPRPNGRDESPRPPPTATRSRKAPLRRWPDTRGRPQRPQSRYSALITSRRSRSRGRPTRWSSSATRPRPIPGAMPERHADATDLPRRAAGGVSCPG